MSWPYIVVALVVLALIALGYNYRSLLQTVFLIVKAEPYEQAGQGAGNILVIGDSTAYGTGAARSEDSVIGRLGKDHLGYQIENNSSNGRTISGALTEAEKITATYDLIVLQIGANDLLAKKPVDAVIQEMKMLLEALDNKTEHIIVITSGNIGAARRFSGTEAAYLEQASRDFTNKMVLIADDYQTVSFVSLFDEPADDPFVSEPDRYLASDGLHPSSEGYGLWYTKASPYFARILESNQTK